MLDINAESDVVSSVILQQIADVFDEATLSSDARIKLDPQQVTDVQNLALKIAGELGIDLIVCRVSKNGHYCLQVNNCTHEKVDEFHQMLIEQSGIRISTSSEHILWGKGRTT